MQCVNCQFHNMPGSQVCGRCGSSLMLATAAINVHPPRARPAIKRLRKTMGVYTATRAIQKASNVTAAVVARPELPDLPTPPVVLRSIVPGWAHLYLGDRFRGFVYLGLFAAFLLPGLLTLGTLGSSLLLGLAFGVHSTAVLDIVSQTRAQSTQFQRLIRTAIGAILLALIIYLPCALLVGRVASPRVLEMTADPFIAGDVVLINDLLTPEPGRVVMYELPPSELPDVREGRVIAHTGLRIDRILAGPGDRVSWRKGVLRVNGAVSPHAPLNPQHTPAALELQVPAGCYLILPSTSPLLQVPDVSTVNDTRWVQMALVPMNHLRGCVWARNAPLGRFRLF